MRTWCLSTLLCASLSWAQAGNQPSEEELFGAPSDAPTKEAVDGGIAVSGPPATPIATERADVDGGSSRDIEDLTGPALKSQFDTEEAKSDPLRLGGTVYQRAVAQWNLGNRFEDVALSAPSLVDAYLDARPNDRVRGMVVGRLTYTPTLGSNTNAAYTQLFESLGALCAPSIPGAPSPGSALPDLSPSLREAICTSSSGGVGSTLSNPSVALDQLWLRFDIAKKVFVTVGRQKAKWGTGRIWNPTDFLSPSHKDPLAQFDLRLGANLLKLHVPVESLGWNFYGYGMLDNAEPADTLGKVGGAARAEFVLGQTEIGLGGAWVKGKRPRYAVDISSGLGPIDVYAEAAFRDGRDFTRWKVAHGTTLDTSRPLSTEVELERLGGLTVQATGGMNFTFNYTENNAMTVGLEYFYNPVGYSSPVFTPISLVTGNYKPFYTGQHYLALYAFLLGLPDVDWVTLSLNCINNLSDPSGIARVDVIFRVLSYLTIETFAAVNYGVRGGEFRLGYDLPLGPPGSGAATLTIPAPVASFGIGLRIAI